MAYKYLNDNGLKAYTKKVKGALKDLHTPIAISTENTTESMAQNVRNIADFVAKAKAAGIDTTKSFRLTLEIDGYPLEGSYDKSNGYIYGLELTDDNFARIYTIVPESGEVRENEIVTKLSEQAVTSQMLDQGARKPIILTPETTEVDEETYQKLLSDDVDVVFKASDGECCVLTYKEDATSSKSFYFSCLSFEGEFMGDMYIYVYIVDINETAPHTCKIYTFYEGQTLDGLIETEFIHKSFLTPVPLTATTSTNKTQLDLFLSKIPNAQVMHCTYKDVYAGTLHKINESWYGVLVGESNTLAGQLSIKLQADGTIVEGTA